ncbi:hypothetical protein [Aquipuribacter hungaricus]|uniref:ABC transporter permease n=1 Tax=Aquipuribacter hungaricus TaxID=545624 RepID=A0ABV7WFV6_9MICO
MTRAVRAELVKLTTTWVWWGLLGIALLLVLLNVGLVSALGPLDAAAAEAFPFPLLTTTEGQLAVVGSGYQSGYLMSAVAGALVATTDFRTGTVAQTFLAVPRRGLVAAAKLVTGGLLGLLYGVVVQVLSLATAWGVLALRGVDLAPAGDLARPVALGVLGIAVWALIGVGFGLLVRHQVVAVVTVVVVVFLLDPLAVLALGAVGEVGPVDLDVVGSYLLTSASTAVVEGFTGGRLLPWWGGALVLLAWAATLGGLAWRTTLRRDVT